MRRAILTGSIDGIIPDEFISLPSFNSHNSPPNLYGSLVIRFRQSTFTPVFSSHQKTEDLTAISSLYTDCSVRSWPESQTFDCGLFTSHQLLTTRYISGYNTAIIMLQLWHGMMFIYLKHEKREFMINEKYQMTLDDTLVLRGMSYWLLFCIIIFTGFQMSCLKISMYIILKEIRNL